MAVMSFTGGAETSVFLNPNHVIVVVSEFRVTEFRVMGGNGAAVKSLALGSVSGKRVVITLSMDQVGVRVETAAVAKPCISASRVRESAMTIEKIWFKMTDLTFLVLQ